MTVFKKYIYIFKMRGAETDKLFYSRLWGMTLPITTVIEDMINTKFL